MGGGEEGGRRRKQQTKKDGVHQASRVPSTKRPLNLHTSFGTPFPSSIPPFSFNLCCVQHTNVPEGKLSSCAISLHFLDLQHTSQSTTKQNTHSLHPQHFASIPYISSKFFKPSVDRSVRVMAADAGCDGACDGWGWRLKGVEGGGKRRRYEVERCVLDLSNVQAKAAKAYDVAKNEIVVVEITHAALNHRDVWMLQGLYPEICEGSILGADAVCVYEGEYMMVEPGIGWEDEEKGPAGSYSILGGGRFDGSFATHIGVPVEALHPLPSHLSPEEGAALPLAGLTAYRAVFTKGGLDERCDGGEGERKRVLVTGVGGGVASLAVLFASSAGHQVYVTSSQPSKIDAAVSCLGAMGGVLYTNDDWGGEVVEMAGGMFDVVVDGAGGSGLNVCIRDVLGVGGVLVHYGATAGPPRALDTVRMFLKQIEFRGSTMGSRVEFARMLSFVSAHRITPPILHVFLLDDLPSALALMGAGSQSGKIILQTRQQTSRL